MKPLFRRYAAAIAGALALVIALPAAATSYSTDYTDLWYNAAEDGWGVNLIQQDDVIFATLFVYDANGNAHWFVASDVEPVSAGNQTSFTGALYQTTGPYFGAAWTARGPAVPVGTLAFNFDSANTATMQYSVNGVAVSKSISRQSWRNNSLAGNFIGGLTAQGTNCGGGVANGPILILYQLSIQHAANQQVSMSLSNDSGQVCTFAGGYLQAGKLGSVSGSWGCTNPAHSVNNAGTFTISNIAVAITGWSGVFTGSDQYCTYRGQFGGIRDVL